MLKIPYLCCQTTNTVKLTIPFIEEITIKDIPKYIPQISEGRVINVYDGDTIHIVGYVLNNPELFKFSVRLNGIDCPEMKSGKSSDKTEYDIAVKAKTHLCEIHNKIVNLKNVNLDKYGRLLADVYYENRHLNKEMIDNRLAVSYCGGTKKIPICWERSSKTGDFT